MAKPNLKMLLVSLNFDIIKKRFRTLIPKNLGSVDQRVLKLLAIKVGVLKKCLLASPGPLKPVSPDSCLPGVESFSNFDGQ